MRTIFVFNIILFFSFSLAEPPTPVVIWHGMGDSCCNPISLGRIIKLIESQIPDVYVHSLQIGSNFFEDTENGFFMNANKQVSLACEKIINDTKLVNGFNAIGFSQGGQFLRAVVQRCPVNMKNLISFGGQHQGIYGLPHCAYPQHKLCDFLRSLLNKAAYLGFVQNQFVQAEYWHDPINENAYKTGSVFLADINNEKTVNDDYKKRLNTLNSFVMVKFMNDTMVEPVDTEWFGFYKPGQGLEINQLRESDLYNEPQDRLGLREMDTNGKLKFIEVEGDHLQFSEDWFINEILNKYLI